MSRLWLWVVLATGCAPGALERGAQAPAQAAEPGSSESVTPSAQPLRRKRVARLAPPFASSPSTRRMDGRHDTSPPAATLPDPVEVAIAR
jgi:hypothetical protein